MSRVARFAAITVLVAALPVLPVSADHPRPGVVERLSVRPDGGQLDGGALQPSVTPDGRYVAFVSGARNLVEGANPNGRRQIFVLDRRLGATAIVSVNEDGEPAALDAANPHISADGRHVVFTTAARNLVEGVGGNDNVYLHDRAARTTEVISVRAGTGNSGGAALNPHVSGDGRYVVFRSTRTDLIDGESMQFAFYRSYIRDRQAGTTDLIARGPSGEPVVSVLTPTVSEDGRYVAFSSTSAVLVEDDTNSAADVFVRDLDTGTIERVSLSSAGEQANASSGTPRISATGRFVVFWSEADNLVPGDRNELRDLFVHDRETGQTELVSVDSAGRQRGPGSLDTSVGISADGRVVVFSAEGLTDDPTHQVFVRDRVTQSTEYASLTMAGVPGNDRSSQPAISADGRSVAFTSLGDDFVPGMTNRRDNVMLRDRGPSIGVAGLRVAPEGEQVRVAGRPVFSGATLSAADVEGGDGLERGLGADLVAAELIWQVEAGQLLVRWGARDLDAQLAADGGGRGVLYGLSLTVGGTDYQLRAAREGAGDHTFGLYRCDLVCDQVAELAGAVGTTGPWVTAALRLDTIGLAPGGTLADLQAWTALGTWRADPTGELTALDLPDATLPVPTVEVGIAAERVPADEVSFTQADALFLDVGLEAPGSGPHTLWVRTCLGEECTLTSTVVALP